MLEEAKEADEKCNERVVHAEVIEVVLDAGSGFVECVRAHEGGEFLDKLTPWMARDEDGARGSGVGVGGGGGCGCGGKCVVVA